MTNYCDCSVCQQLLTDSIQPNIYNCPDCGQLQFEDVPLSIDQQIISLEREIAFRDQINKSKNLNLRSTKETETDSWQRSFGSQTSNQMALQKSLYDEDIYKEVETVSQYEAPQSENCTLKYAEFKIDEGTHVDKVRNQRNATEFGAVQCNCRRLQFEAAKGHRDQSAEEATKQRRDLANSLALTDEIKDNEYNNQTVLMHQPSYYSSSQVDNSPLSRSSLPISEVVEPLIEKRAHKALNSSLPTVGPKRFYMSGKLRAAEMKTDWFGPMFIQGDNSRSINFDRNKSLVSQPKNNVHR